MKLARLNLYFLLQAIYDPSLFKCSYKEAIGGTDAAATAMESLRAGGMLDAHLEPTPAALKLIERVCKAGNASEISGDEPKNKLSPWMPVPNAPDCCMRIIVGGDPTKAYDRYAFIEKTPRIRIRHPSLRLMASQMPMWQDWLDWMEGTKGDGGELQADGTYAYDTKSQEWCDRVLTALGYELT